MSEYELIDLAAAIMANFFTTFTIFLSIVTAYVIAAFMAGDKLTKVQVSIINMCFLVSSGIIGWLSLSLFQRAATLAQRGETLRDVTILPFYSTWMVGALFAALILGCIFFMWNVRHAGTGSE